MNFKTTLVLLVLLVGVGVVVLVTRNGGSPTDPPVTPPTAPSVLDVKSADVTGLTLTGPDGKVALAVEKTGANWRLTQPVQAAADAYQVSNLVDNVTTNLKPTSTVKATGPDAPKTGTDHPQYTVAVRAGARTDTLVVGDTLGVGDGVYAQAAGSDTVDVVPASLLTTLAKPASDLRKTQLFDTVTAADVQQLTVKRRDKPPLMLQKLAGTWKLVDPKLMPADASAVDELLYAVINMTPVSFVDTAPVAAGLTRPTAVVSFSTAAPATQPTTGPATAPAMTTVTFGGYDDVQKKNVFASLSDGTVVKVAATVLASLDKTPLDLRDKAVVDLDPAKVTSVTIATETTAATQPASRPASTKTIVLARRPPKPVLVGPIGPARPATAATTGPTSAPATAPAVPSTEWTVDGAPADDAKVTALLGQFHPLRADKFLAASAIANPARRFTVTLTAGASPTVVQIAEPGHDLSLVGTDDGLTFNLPATMAADLAGEFKKQ